MRTLLAIKDTVLAVIDQHQPTLQRCYLGLGSLASGLTLSHLAIIKEGLQVTSLVIGCAVGIATFISILRKKDK